MKSKAGLIVLIFVLSLGCSPTMIIYGIKKPKVISEKKILRFSKKMNIPTTDVFVLDTMFHSYLYSLKPNNSKQTIKNHIQPLQALYFNNKGELVSYQINCYAGGVPNINWDRDSILTVFPPKQQAPIDTILSVNTQIEYLRPLTHSENIKTENKEYIVFVYWSKFMGRQTKRFIKFIQKNSFLNKGGDIRVIYVNTDAVYAKSDFFN